MAWSKTFDFTVDDGGWQVIPADPFGNYVAGIGWQSAWGKIGLNWDERLYIEIDGLDPTTIETMTTEYVFTGTCNSSPGPGLAGYFYEGIAPYFLTRDSDPFTCADIINEFYTYEGSRSVANVGHITMIMNGSSYGSGQQTQIITSITLTGPGVSPFDPTPGKIKVPSTFLAGEGETGGFDKVASLSSEGAYIYIAAFNDLTTPTLIKFDTDLDADGTVVFEPGNGTNIGVQCGSQYSENVWVAGNFGGTNTVEKTTDGGTSWEVKDDATMGTIRAFEVGPLSDNRVIVFDEDNGDILETVDDGENWTTINGAVTPLINSIARNPLDLQECIVGNEGAATNSIDYTVNSGVDLEDYQVGVYPNADATKVLATSPR